MALPWSYEGEPTAKNLELCIREVLDHYIRDTESNMYTYVPNKKATAPRNAVYNLCADRHFAC